MFNDATGFSEIYIVCGRTDLRYGIDSLAALISQNYNLNPFAPNTLFLFCGRRSDRLKGLLWEGDGFLLIYKRLEQGNFQWPRTQNEVLKMTQQQFRWLTEGLSIKPRKVVQKVKPKRVV